MFGIPYEAREAATIAHFVHDYHVSFLRLSSTVSPSPGHVKKVNAGSTPKLTAFCESSRATRLSNDGVACH